MRSEQDDCTGCSLTGTLRQMPTCREITELVTDFLEGRMGFADRLRFRMHVGMCMHCRGYLRQMRATVATLGRLPDEPLPDAIHNELVVRFRNWSRT